MFFAEIEVPFALKRDEMDVGMRNLHSKHGYPHPLAWDGSFQGYCDLAGKCPKAGISFFIEMEDVVVFHVFGDYQSVTLREWTDIKECVVSIVLCNLVGWYLQLLMS